jgi:uncharacterized protein YukE
MEQSHQAGQLIVTPEAMRTTSQNLDNAIQSVIATAHQYVSTHQDAMAVVWSGDGAGSSMTTAGRIQEDLNKVMTGGQHLSEGLTKAASLMEAHEAEQAHTFNGFAGH